MKRNGVLVIVLLVTAVCSAQPRRKVIINQDCSGPGGSNLQTVALMIQSPQVEVLGITVVSGDQWRDEEVAHTLRLLEIMGRTDIPVVPGALYPLVHRRDEAQRWQQLYGKLAYTGAWDDRWWHEPTVVPHLPEGQPTTKPSDEDAPHFLIRMVRKYPHEVTIYEGGPMTNLALAISLDPQFPVRSRSSGDRSARALEQDCLHAGRHLDQGPQYPCLDEADRGQRHSVGALRCPLRHVYDRR